MTSPCKLLEKSRAHQGFHTACKGFHCPSQSRGLPLALVLPGSSWGRRSVSLGCWPNSLGTSKAKETTFPSHLLLHTPWFSSMHFHHPCSGTYPYPSFTACHPIFQRRPGNPHSRPRPPSPPASAETPEPRSSSQTLKE